MQNIWFLLMISCIMFFFQSCWWFLTDHHRFYPPTKKVVMLIVDHDDKGTVGVVLNRPTKLTAADVDAWLCIKSWEVWKHFCGITRKPTPSIKMVYLPTFGWFSWVFHVGKYTSPIDGTRQFFPGRPPRSPEKVVSLVRESDPQNGFRWRIYDIPDRIHGMKGIFT